MALPRILDTLAAMSAARLPLLCLVAGLALGVLIGLSIGEPAVQAGSPEPDARTAERSAPPAEPEAERRAPDDLAAVAAPESTGSAKVPLVDEGRAKALARAAIERSEAADLSGAMTGVITGVVVDSDGEPIEGADLVTTNRPSRSSSWRNRLGRKWGGVESLEASVARSARNAIEYRARLRHVTSGADGTFRLDRLDEGEVDVQCYAEGYSFTRQRSNSGGELRFVGSRVYAYALDFRLPDGTQPESVSVKYSYARGSNGTSSSSTTWTPDDPTIQIQSPAAEISGTIGKLSPKVRGRLPEYSSETHDLKAADGDSDPVRIDLNPNSALLIVVNGSRQRLEGGYLSVKLVPGEVDESFDWSAYQLKRLQSSALDAGPRVFHASQLRPGRYTVGVNENDVKLAQTRVVDVAEGLNEVTIELAERDLGDVLRLTCTSTSGEPVNDARVSFNHRSGNGSYGSSGSIPGDAPGEVLVIWDRVLGDRGFKSGDTVEFDVRSRSMGTVSFVVDSKLMSQSVVFAEPASLTVEVVADNPALYQVMLTPVVEENGRSRGGTGTPPGSNGTARFTSLQPGRYVASLTAIGRRGGFGGSFPLAKETIDLEPGERSLSLTPLATYDLVVVVPEGKRVNRLTLRAQQDDRRGPSADARPDDSRRATFSNVPAGVYTLSSGYSMGAGMTVQVPSGEIVFDPPELDCLRVRSVTAGGLAEKAGLRTGDYVLAVGEHDIRGEAAMRIAFSGIMLKEQELTLRRGNRTLTIKLGPLQPEGGEMIDPGFDLVPDSIGR